MLCKNNLILVLDANILKGILKIQDQDLDMSITRWLEQTVKAMECESRGKIIMIAVSTAVLKDYAAGMRGCISGNPKKVIDLFFKRLPGSRISIHRMRNINLTIRKLETVKIQRSVFRDKDDQRYFELVNAVCESDKLRDHRVIIATEDRVAYGDLDKNLIGRNITLVDGIPKLEEAIKC